MTMAPRTGTSISYFKHKLLDRAGFLPWTLNESAYEADALPLTDWQGAFWNGLSGEVVDKSCQKWDQWQKTIFFQLNCPV